MIINLAAIAGGGGGESDPTKLDKSTFNRYVTEQASKDAEQDEAISNLSLFKFPNVTIMGEPTIQNGQVSDFSLDDYMQFPFLVDLGARHFVINMCFTTGENVSIQENILDSNKGLALAVRNGKFVMALSADGETWFNEYEGWMDVQPNTTYYVRIRYDLMSYKLEVSTDKENYEVIASADFALFTLYPKQIIIGRGIEEHVFTGSINLNYCDLSINGSIIWTGMDDAGLSTRLATDLSNIDQAGVEKIKEISSEKNITMDVNFNDGTAETYNVVIK